MSKHRHVIPTRHFFLLLLDHFLVSRSSPNFSPLSQIAFSTFVQEYAQVEDEIRRLWTEVGKIGVGVRLFIGLELLKSSQASSSLSPFFSSRFLPSSSKLLWPLSTKCRIHAHANQPSQPLAHTRQTANIEADRARKDAQVAGLAAMAGAGADMDALISLMDAPRAPGVGGEV